MTEWLSKAFSTPDSLNRRENPNPEQAMGRAHCRPGTCLFFDFVYSKSFDLGLRPGSFERKPKTNKDTKKITVVYTKIFNASIIGETKKYLRKKEIQNGGRLESFARPI